MFNKGWLMSDGEIKFKSWRIRNDALTNGNSRIPIDHISQTVFRIEENDNKSLLILFAILMVIVSIGVSIVFNFFVGATILLITALVIYFALEKQKQAYFKVYSSSGQSISYYINETNADKLKSEIDMFNLFIDELLQRKREYSTGINSTVPSLKNPNPNP